MRGPAHYLTKTLLEVDLDREVLSCGPGERQGMAMVLKLWIGAYATLGGGSVYSAMKPPYNVTTNSHEVVAQVTAHSLDMLSKFPGLVGAGLGAWACAELVQLHHQLKNLPNAEPDEQLE